MPYQSIIGAVVAKYGTLTAANFPNATRPPIWLDEAPQEGPTAAQQRLPYVIIKDGGGTDQWDMEVNAVTPGTISLEIYYADGSDPLGDCDAALKAILWNGLNPNQVAGIAFMTPDLAAPQYGMARSVMPTRSKREYAGVNLEDKRVYKVTQEFDVISNTRGTG